VGFGAGGEAARPKPLIFSPSLLPHQRQ